MQKENTNLEQKGNDSSPCVLWVLLFATFLGGGKISENPLDSEQTETGESCDWGDRASSWMEKQIQLIILTLVQNSSLFFLDINSELMSAKELTTKQ